MIIKGNKAGLYITDYNFLIAELNRIEPTLVGQLRKDFREIAKPVKREVQNAIPNTPPTSGIHKKRRRSSVSGFYPIKVPGRVTWGPNAQNKNKPARSVAIETASPRQANFRSKKNNLNDVAIARLRVDNAATVIADLAGSSGAWVNKRRYTRPYEYSRSPSGVRIHRINNQGLAMIRALGGKGSRYVWPARDRAVPATFNQTDKVLNAAINRINVRLR